MRFKEESKYYDNGANILTDDERKKFIFCSIYNKWPFVDKFQRMNQKTAVDEIINNLGAK